MTISAGNGCDTIAIRIRIWMYFDDESPTHLVCHETVQRHDGIAWSVRSHNSVIYREFNCLFVHVPKTAGQSVEQFFMNRLGLDWEKDREVVLLNNNPDPARGTQKLAHMTASEYIQLGYLVLVTTPACKENPATSPAELEKGLSVSRSGRVCKVNTLRPCWGPTAIR